MKLIIRNDKTYRQGKAKLLFSTSQNKGYRMPLNMKFRIESLTARCWFKCMIVERRLVLSIVRKASYVWHATINKHCTVNHRIDMPVVSIIRQQPARLYRKAIAKVNLRQVVWRPCCNILVLQRLQALGQTKCPAQEVQTVRAQRAVWPVQQPFPVGCKPRDVSAVHACGQSR